MLSATPATRLRVSILFPTFEAAMPLIGLALGTPLGHAIGDSANYIAIAVLLAFGLYTLIGSEEHEERTIARLADARGTGALLLGLSISLDELAIGFTLGLQYPVTNPGAWDTRGTTSSRNTPKSASGSSMLTLTTTACIAALLTSGSGRLTVSGQPICRGKNQATRSVTSNPQHPLELV